MHPDIQILSEKNTDSPLAWVKASVSEYTAPELVEFYIRNTIGQVLPSFYEQLSAKNTEYFRDLLLLPLWIPVRRVILDKMLENDFPIWEYDGTPEYCVRAAELVFLNNYDDKSKILDALKSIPVSQGILCEALSYRCPMEVIHWLFENGVSANEPYAPTGTPLMWACQSGFDCQAPDCDVIQFLLDRGADPTALYNTRSVMSWCDDTPGGHAAIERVYTNQEQVDRELRQVIRSGRLYRAFSPDRVRLLVRLGADIDLNMETSHDEHITPLMFACHNGRVPLIQLLLELGADKNIRAVKEDKDSRAFTFYLNYLNRAHRNDWDTLALLE